MKNTSIWSVLMYQNSRRNEIMELPWPDSYYEPISGDRRYKLLEAALGEEDSEENRLRLKLWEYRYGSVSRNNGKPSMDNFMKLWLDLEFYSQKTNSIFGVKNAAKEIKRDIDSLGYQEMQEYGELGLTMLYQELVQAGRYYFNLCASDRNYTTELFGIKKISDERIVDKITGDVYRVCYMTPKAFKLQEDLEMFTKAVTEALEIEYPEQIKNLNAVIQKNN